MSVNLRFLADFTDFVSALDKANVKLREFSLEPAKVERALSRMTDTFSGRQLISEASLAAEAVERIGGTSKLTEAELKRVATQAQEAATKLRLMGQDVPDRIAALAKAIDPLPEKLTLAQRAGDALKSSFTQLTASFTLGNLLTSTVNALGNFARDAVASAGAVADLAGKTGLSTDAIQRMQFVAEQTGSTVETFTKAVFQLGVRLSSGDNSVRKAAEDLGLSFEAIRRAKPEEQFDQVARALEKMAGPQERNRAAVALFGKTAEEILPAISEGYGKLADEANTMSDEQIAALDRAGDAMARFARNTKTAIGSIIADFVIAGEQFNKLNLGSKVGVLLDIFTGRGASAGVTLAKQIATDVKEASDVIDGSGVPAFQGYIHELEEARHEVNKLTAEEREQIKAGIELGRSTQELADRYGVTTQAVKLLTESLKLQNQLMGGDLIQKANDLVDTLARMQKQGLSPAKTAFDDIVKSMESAQRAMESTGRAGEALYQRLEAARRKFSGLTPEGLIPSTHLGVPLAQAPNVEQNLESSTAGQNAEDEFWRQMIEQQGRLADAVDETAKAHAEASQAAVEGADAASKGYGFLHQRIIEATTALKIMVPLGTSWVQAYRDAGLFVNDLAGAVAGRGPRVPGGTPVPVTQVTVNAQGSFFQTPAAMQQLGDNVGAAVLARVGRA